MFQAERILRTVTDALRGRDPKEEGLRAAAVEGILEVRSLFFPRAMRIVTIIRTHFELSASRGLSRISKPNREHAGFAVSSWPGNEGLFRSRSFWSS